MTLDEMRKIAEEADAHDNWHLSGLRYGGSHTGFFNQLRGRPLHRHLQSQARDRADHQSPRSSAEEASTGIILDFDMTEG